MFRLFALSAVAALVLGAFPLQSHQARAQAVDWPTHAFDQLRTGYNPDELALNPATASGLHLLWSANLGAAVNAQPLVIHDLLIDGVPTETVIAASTNGLIAAFEATTGKQIWSDQEQVQKTNCGFYPSGVFGIPNTPVYDRQDNALLFVDGAGLLYEIDAATGANKPGWPIQLVANPGLEYVRSGLNLFNRTVYIGISSYCDQGAYNGSLMAVDIDSRQLLSSFVPSATGNGGAIWGYGGVAIDASDSALYLATGNSLSGEHQGLAESVIRLDPSLNVAASNYPGLTGGDVDFGNTPLLFETSCGQQLVAFNKDGQLFNYMANSIGSGPVQSLQMNHGGPNIGMSAVDPTSGLIFVPNMGDSPDGTSFMHGLLAFSTNAQCQLAKAWQAVQGPNNGGKVGPPSTVSGVAVYGTGGGGQLFAFDKLGNALWNSGTLMQGAIVSPPTIANGKLYSGTYAGMLYAFGVDPSPLVAAILPGARTVEVGSPATVFATMVNASAQPLANCQPSLPLSAPSGLGFSFQITDPATNMPVGQINQPVSIPAGSAQSFLLAFQSSSALSETLQPIAFACDGATPAPSYPEIGAVNLTFSGQPVADVVALVATVSNNGVVTVPLSQNQMGAFAAATINVGGAGQLTLSADTGTVPLPVSVTLCATNPATAQCLAPPASSLQLSLGAGTTSTFSAFVTASGPVPPAFGLSRIFLRFTDANGVQHGSTSVALETD